MKKLMIVFITNLCLLSVSPYLFAEGVATYSLKHHDTSMKLYYLDDDHIKIDVFKAGKAKNSILKTGNKTYIITEDMVMDAEQIAKMTGQLMNKGHHSNNFSNVTFKATGKHKTIAGIQGEIYDITAKDQVTHLVLTKDKSVLEFQNAMEHLMTQLSMPFTNEVFTKVKSSVKLKNMSVLSDGKNFKLVSIKKTKLDKKIFALPNKKMQRMPNIDDIMKKYGKH